MNNSEIYEELEKEFLATVIGELMPGVLHNFANPLNGIMGRAKLLQRRFEDYQRKLNVMPPDVSDESGKDKISRDIGMITSEAERFLSIFKDLSWKISILSTHEQYRINISQLVQMEVRFADFYLDMKHDYKKHLRLDFNLPEVLGCAAGYSLCISALLRSAKERMKESLEKEIFIETGCDEKSVFVAIKDKGQSISDPCKRLSAGDAVESPSIPDADRGVYYSLMLLKQYGASVQISGEQGLNRVCINVPYR